MSSATARSRAARSRTSPARTPAVSGAQSFGQAVRDEAGLIVPDPDRALLMQSGEECGEQARVAARAHDQICQVGVRPGTEPVGDDLRDRAVAQRTEDAAPCSL